MNEKVQAKLDELFGFGGEVGLRLYLTMPCKPIHKVPDIIEWMMSAEDEEDLMIRYGVLKSFVMLDFERMIEAYNFVKTGIVPAPIERRS